ncbi:MAG: YhjD/YihY/BrkB family envelope integrity protein [Gemmatimonadaceae bacterium]
MRSRAESSAIVAVTKAAFKDFGEDQGTTRAAALSYYTIFALPPLLILLVKLAGLIWSPDAVQQALEAQFAGVVGTEGAATVRGMISSGNKATHGLLASALSIGGLLFGATGAFLSIQNALNAIWEVKPDPRYGGIKRFIMKRLLSFGMLLGLAFLLAVSLALTAFVASLGAALGAAGIVVEILNIALSLVVLAVLFTAMFKFLPDAVIPWRGVWVGGVATAVLFEIGKFGIGLYLGHSNPGNPFGAAKALAVILIWIYYSGVLLLFGAEFTQHFAESRGHAVEPKNGAVRIDSKERIVHDKTSEQSSIARHKNPETNAGATVIRANESDGRAEARDGRSRLAYNEQASIGELFKSLTADSSELVRQEIQLAKLELQESVANAGRASAKLGTAAVIALPGVMAVTAALVIGLGILMNSYWLSALLVGAAILLAAGITARSGITQFKSGFKPQKTISSVKRDADWAKREAVEVKRQLTA